MGADDMAEQIIPSQQQQSTRLVLLLICIVGAISLVALVLAAVSLSQKGTTNFNVGPSSLGSTGTGNDDKIWTFAIGHDGTNLEYIEKTTGTLRGFHVDIVNAVCAIAQKNCRLIWDIYQNCWTSEAGERARGGLGLMSGWYDACTGWFNTYDRALTVDFTTAFRKPFMGAFFTKPNNPDDFQWTDLTGKKIAFGDGWAQDEHCLARMGDKITGVPLQTSQIIHYSTREAATAAVLNGDVAAYFTNTNQFRESSAALVKVSDELMCTKDGGCMMMRKDRPVAAWWNPAFERLKETDYKDICSRVDSDHGAQPGLGGEVICVD